MVIRKAKQEAKTGGRMRVGKNNKANMVGIGSIACFAFLMLMFISPVSSNEVNAESTKVAESNVAINTLINVSPMISVGVQQAVEMDLAPTAQGVFDTNTAKVNVITNSKEGYKILISAGGEDNKLRSTDQTNVRTIDPVVGVIAENDFTNNTWGYAISESDSNGNGSSAARYQAVPTSAQEMSLGNTMDKYQASYNLTFGTKVGADLPAGSYTGSVLLSAVANPVTITSLEQLTYMQDMSSTICNNTTEHTTKRLIDTRDGKAYWVAKLKDGNCWMVQNLALDLSTDRPLTSSDTNISVDFVDPVTGKTGQWTPTSNTETTVPSKLDNTTTPTLNESYYTNMSWDVGQNYVLATPTRGITCNSTASPSDDSSSNDGSNSLRPGDTFSTQCEDIVYVGNGNWFPTYQATTGLWRGEPAGNGGDVTAEGLVAVNPDPKYDTEGKTMLGGTYDAHYLIGNYYQFNTATLGFGGTKENPNNIKGNSTQSICPKGWILPTSGNQNIADRRFYLATSEEKKSFANLFSYYGYGDSGYGFLADGNNEGKLYKEIISGLDASGNVLNNFYGNVAAAPLYFVRGGYVNLGVGSLRIAGSQSYNWSATTYANAVSAYFFHFHGGSFYPSDYDPRYFGISVRCLAE